MKLVECNVGYVVEIYTSINKKAKNIKAATILDIEHRSNENPLVMYEDSKKHVGYCDMSLVKRVITKRKRFKNNLYKLNKHSLSNLFLNYGSKKNYRTGILGNFVALCLAKMNVEILTTINFEKLDYYFQKSGIGVIQKDIPLTGFVTVNVKQIEKWVSKNYKKILFTKKEFEMLHKKNNEQFEQDFEEYLNDCMDGF